MRPNSNSECGLRLPQVRNLNPKSEIKTTGESIVREFRIAGRGARVEIPVLKEPISIFERAVRVFLILAAGWLFGYLHHFLAMK